MPSDREVLSCVRIYVDSRLQMSKLKYITRKVFSNPFGKVHFLPHRRHFIRITNIGWLRVFKKVIIVFILGIT
jgi:hypothetical protein